MCVKSTVMPQEMGRIFGAENKHPETLCKGGAFQEAMKGFQSEPEISGWRGV